MSDAVPTAAAATNNEKAVLVTPTEEVKMQLERTLLPSPAYAPIINGNGVHEEERSSSPDSWRSHSPSPSPMRSRRPSEKDDAWGGFDVEGDNLTLAKKIESRIASGDKFFSLEFFPPRTKAGAINLLSRFDRMSLGGPLFVDVTWHPAGDPAGDSETSSMMIAHSALNYSGLETMLHMTCVGASEEVARSYLDKAKALGIRSILALRGDQPGRTEVNKRWQPQDGQLNYASDLVKLIRDNEEYRDAFSVCVAGYPTGHPEAMTYEDDLIYLKNKVEAGAHFIITQLFFKASTFKRFVDDCRAIGITCPIIPGVLPIQSYDSLRHMVKMSKLEVPNEISSVVQSLKGNDAAIRKYGVHQASEMVRELLSSGYAPGVHIYTLNREVGPISLLKRLGLWKSDPMKMLPFKMTAHSARTNEEVRPIFWSHRSKAYIYRTRHWDEFPNGRWGDVTSPAFGELKDYHLFYLDSTSTKEERLRMWGKDIESEEDVFDVFKRYLTGEPDQNGVIVEKTIFNDEKELDPEIQIIRDQLIKVNKNGVITVNSQPAVNCAPSTDRKVGWGEPGGYVFQKAYLEFFTSEENVIALLQVLGRYPNVNFQVLNHDASINCTNLKKLGPVAVTWGVFPGKEVKQPTIVDPVSFDAWREEAFGLWREQWASLYDEGSRSREVLDKIVHKYLLVNLVDNDFVRGNCLWNVLDDMFNRTKLNMKLTNPASLESVIKTLSYTTMIEKD